MWFPFYHGVPPQHAAGLRRHLETLLARGRFLSWTEALDRLASPDALAGPHFCLSFDDGHKDWLSNVVPLLLSLNIPATFFVTMDKVVDGFSESRLTWADCNRLLSDGMALGSHSLTHPRLALLSDAAARREVEQSRQELEQRTGAAVLDFSAPFGLPGVDFGEREVEMVQAAGYRSFASAKPEVMQPGESPYRIPRAGLSPAWPLPAVRVRVHE
jgi:peptidoglycan/xylan/chitin deacetylase (PgdA/CDA1 family)